MRAPLLGSFKRNPWFQMIFRLTLALLTGIATIGAAAADPAPPGNDVYFSLIRTEPDQLPPVGWRRLGIAPTVAAVPRDGFYASTFVSGATGQIVIAIRRFNPIPILHQGTYDTDAAILFGLAPARYAEDVRAFVAAVETAAAAQSPPLSTVRGNVFVTGNSLGAYGAELAAREFGYGGVGFGGPGLPGYRAPAERPGNFTNYLLRGDPVAEHATDTGIRWGGWLEAAEAGDHCGRIEWLGSPGHERALQAAVTLAGIQPISPLASPLPAAGFLGLAVEIGLWHMSPRYKTALGIETLPRQQ